MPNSPARPPLRPEVLHWLRQGDALLARGRPAEAAGAFALATRVDPINSRAFERMGVALACAGETEAALTSLVHAVELAPTAPAPIGALAALLVSTGQLGRAHRLLDALPAACRSAAPWHTQRAAVLLESGDFAGARTLLAAAPAAARADAALLSQEIRTLLYDPAIDAAALHAAACAWERTARLPPPSPCRRPIPTPAAVCASVF